MLYWTCYKGHVADVRGKKRKYDNNIYTFDIETSSCLKFNNDIIPAIEYDKLTDDERDMSDYRAFMYIWMFGVNDIVYYGRTWDELKSFLKLLDENNDALKYVFVHNLAFEFQFLKSQFHFEDVMARKSHKVMTASLRDYNIIFKCSYFMSNCALKYLTELYNLPVEKKVGDLDYNKIRLSITPLTDEELKYCEYDCLVVYHYILRELESYEDVKHIPTTSTGKVRRELKNLVMNDYSYKSRMRKAISTDPVVFNRLQEAFFGGYTHASYTHASSILKDVDSYDITSSYPYCLVSEPYPSSEFKRCFITKVSQMSNRLSYILVVEFRNIKCKYLNNFISMNKCKDIKGGVYDNGRIISAKELRITLTDIDFYFILDTYKGQYKILECYWANKSFLPKQFINFVLDKYVAKTEFKDVAGKEVEYSKEKNKFNSLYGSECLLQIQ